MANHYDIPSWAGKPPVGTHLDVMKGDKLVQKLMLDEKKCYLFGRNPQMNDFCIDHQSCSRVHAAFVYHKHLQRAFLVDLGSTHGTFIGSIRLEGHKPTQLAPDSTFHFGASTRHYVMRQRPQGTSRNIIEQLEKGDKTEGAAMLGLPESETELDNLTEFNTAHNRRISMLGIGDDNETTTTSTKKKRRSVTFNEEEELINPEDIDPSVGKFRNMIHTTVVKAKRAKLDNIGPTSGLTNDEKITHPLKHSFHTHNNSLYSDLPALGNSIYSGVVASRLGITLPNPAPDVDPVPRQVEEEPQEELTATGTGISEPKKKKYAKEAWPGKKNMPTLLV